MLLGNWMSKCKGLNGNEALLAPHDQLQTDQGPNVQDKPQSSQRKSRQRLCDAGSDPELMDLPPNAQIRKETGFLQN